MATAEWVVGFLGVAVAVATLFVWLGVRRHRTTVVAPPVNPGLIQPDLVGPPANISPAMIGALIDDSVGVRDVFLTVIDLAVRGYLRLKPLMGDDSQTHDWTIRHTDKPGESLRDFETTLLEACVKAGKPGPTATLSSLFSDTPDAVTKDLTQLRGAVARTGWFTDGGRTPGRRSPWGAVGALVLLLGLVAAGTALVGGFTGSLLPGLVGATLMVVSGLILTTLTHQHPGTTVAGDQTKVQVQRYRTWLQDLQPHDIVPDQAGHLFGANIAAAMAFRMGSQFAGVFDAAIARHRNWGGTMTIVTNWLDAPSVGVGDRVALLEQLLTDTVRLARRHGLDEPEN